MLRIIVNQKISVLQELDAQEIEGHAKLGGFASVEIRGFEQFVRENGADIKKQSVQILMIKD